MDLDELAQQNLAGLQDWANHLLLMAKTLVKSTQYLANDHFAFMALTYLSRQIDHMESLLILDTSGDVQLIVRSMLEGMCQLLWANQEPKSRSLQWRLFYCISDWREMQAALSSGVHVDAERKKDVEAKRIQYGEQFIKPSADRKRRKSGKLPKDPYYENWTRLSVRRIFDDVQADALHQLPYAMFSDWHHWSPSSFARAISHQDINTTFVSRSFTRSWLSLVVGFQCLLQTAELVDSCLKLDMTEPLAELKSKYIAWHQGLSEDVI